DATKKIEASVTPEEANPKCFYASGNTDIATVDSDGNVKGIAEGETTVTVRAASKPSVMKSVKVTVGPKSA
ncbi:MAG: Ig-like domain-containing protein, partial [Eggerthella sp.]|uniref:Ig-like domain-containing protein n=1 Tax=Eggerthella sp. TaxID=1929886 RepID=UPI0028FF844E